VINVGRPIYCRGDTYIIDDDKGHYEIIKAIEEHVRKCHRVICYTDYGTFTMVDGILFEEVVY